MLMGLATHPVVLHNHHVAALRESRVRDAVAEQVIEEVIETRGAVGDGHASEMLTPVVAEALVLPFAEFEPAE